MPGVYGSRNSDTKVSAARPSDSRGRSGAGSRDRGSCTFHAIRHHAAAEQPASTQKPIRQEVASTSHASGVPVASSPIPPMLRTAPDIAANRSAAKCRAMNTVHTKKAGAQHPVQVDADSHEQLHGAEREMKVAGELAELLRRQMKFGL